MWILKLKRGDINRMTPEEKEEVTNAVKEYLEECYYYYWGDGSMTIDGVVSLIELKKIIEVVEAFESKKQETK